jgi:hypothetical protein
MAKTVSSAGLADFIQTGKPTQVFENDQTSKRQAEAAKAKLETKLAIVDSPAPEGAGAAKPNGATPPADGEKAAAPAETAPAAKTEAHEEPDDLKGIPLSEAAQKRLDKWLAKRTAMTKTAQEEAAAAKKEAEESERFAETLFNEREQWRKRAEEAEKRTGTPPAAPEPPKRPETKDFLDDKGQFKAIEYAEALAAWSAKNALEEDRKAQDAKRAAAEKEAADAAVRAKIAAAQAKYPDWEQKVTGSDITLQNECLHFMAESEHGMDIAYYLADNPKEAARIRAMRPLVAVAELGKLQMRFEKAAEPPVTTPPAKVETSGAPPPITPISTSGSGSVVVDPAKMNFKQLREWHKERRKAGLER